MADFTAPIKPKKSSTASEVPQASDLEVAEIAINTADGLMWTKHTDDSIVQIGGGGGATTTQDLTDVKTFTAPSDYFFSSSNGVININSPGYVRLASNFTPRTILVDRFDSNSNDGQTELDALQVGDTMYWSFDSGATTQALEVEYKALAASTYEIRFTTVPNIENFDAFSRESPWETGYDWSYQISPPPGGFGPQDGQVFTWVDANSQWEPVTPTGGGATTLGGLTDVEPITEDQGYQHTQGNYQISGEFQLNGLGMLLNFTSQNGLGILPQPADNGSLWFSTNEYGPFTELTIVGTVTPNSTTYNIPEFADRSSLDAVLTGSTVIYFHTVNPVNTAPVDGHFLTWVDANSQWESRPASIDGLSGVKMESVRQGYEFVPGDPSLERGRYEIVSLGIRIASVPLNEGSMPIPADNGSLWFSTNEFGPFTELNIVSSVFDFNNYIFIEQFADRSPIDDAIAAGDTTLFFHSEDPTGGPSNGDQLLYDTANSRWKPVAGLNADDYDFSSLEIGKGSPKLENLANLYVNGLDEGVDPFWQNVIFMAPGGSTRNRRYNELENSSGVVVDSKYNFLGENLLQIRDGAYINYNTYDYNLGGDDFTIEWFMYNPQGVTGRTGTVLMVGDDQETGTDFAYAVNIGQGGLGQLLRFTYSTDGVAPGLAWLYVWSLPDAVSGTFNHFAICRKNNEIYAFYNGERLGTSTMTDAIHLSSGSLTRFRSIASGVDVLLPEALYGALRITRGIARYFYDFKPLDTAFGEGWAKDLPYDGQVLTWSDDRKAWVPSYPRKMTDFTKLMPSSTLPSIITAKTVGSFDMQFTNSVIVTFDATPTEGDLMVVAMVLPTSQTPSDWDSYRGLISAIPAGWEAYNKNFVSQITSDDIRAIANLHIFSKIAGASESNSYSFDIDGSTTIDTAYVAFSVRNTTGIHAIDEVLGFGTEVQIEVPSGQLNATIGWWSNGSGSETTSQTGTGLTQVISASASNTKMSMGYTTSAGTVTSVRGTTDIKHNVLNIQFKGPASLPMCPVYADEAAAVTGGLSKGDIYSTSTGELRIKL